MKKAAVVFIISAILFAVFCGCGKKKPSDTTAEKTDATETQTAEQITEKPEYTPHFPDVRYEGGFNILCDGSADDTANALFSEESGGVRLRAKAVRERFGADITLTLAQDTSSALRLSTKGGENAYDAVVGRMSHMFTSAANGDLLDLNVTEGLDLSKSYWDQSANDRLSVGGKLFFTVGDIITAEDDATRVITFNKKLAGSFCEDDLYAVAAEGSWTYDYLYTLIKSENRSAPIIWDGITTFAFAADNGAAYGFFYSSGLSFVSKNESGKLYFDDSAERTKKVQSVLDYTLKIMNDGSFSLNTGRSDGNVSAEETFSSNNAMFCLTRLSSVEVFRDAGVNFGILPLPKYDGMQREYLTFVEPDASLVGIPDYGTDKAYAKRSGVILEAMAYYGHAYIMPGYTEKLTGGEKADADILDTVLKNRIYDPGYINDWGMIASSYAGLVSENKNNYTASYSKVIRSAKNKLDKFQTKIFG